MGYRLPDRTVDLVFEDGAFEGLEVTARTNVAMDALRYFTEWSETKTSEGADVIRELHQVMRTWADAALVSWNLEDRDGRPVPATAEAATAHLDPVAFAAMVKAWIGEVGKLDAPLRRRSPSGRRSRARRA